MERRLVVAPRSVLRNWENEAKRFRPGLKVSIYHGPDRKLDEEANLIITTYALLRGDQEKLAAKKWDMVILDEAQAIKNPQSQVAQAAFKIDADFRLTLTGTPVENRLDELWSQLHFVNPGLLGGRKDFDERYAQPISRGEKGYSDPSTESHSTVHSSAFEIRSGAELPAHRTSSPLSAHTERTKCVQHGPGSHAGQGGGPSGQRERHGGIGGPASIAPGLVSFCLGAGSGSGGLIKSGSC